MDELTRALGRKYHREPSPENAALYIRSLERIWGGASDPCLLLDIWGSLILGLFDPSGINLAVYDSLLDLTTLLFGKKVTEDLNNHVDATRAPATDGGFYLGSSESWFDDFLLKIDYKCCHPTTCSLPAYGHDKCQALTNHGRCECPGCYTYTLELTDPGRLRLGPQTIDDVVNLCWHHYQIMQSRPKIEFDLDI